MPTTTAAEFLATLPRIDYLPILPPDQNKPPYDQMLEQDLAYWPQLNAAIVAKHELVLQVLADPDTFSSRNAMPPLTRHKSPAVAAALAGLPPEPPMVLNADRDAHRRMRRVFAQGFTSQRVKTRHSLMEATAAMFAERLRPAGKADLVTDFAAPYLAVIVNDLYGYPADDSELIDEVSRAVNVLITPGQQDWEQLDAAQMLHRAHRYLTAQFTKRARPRPDAGRDLLYDLVHGHDGDTLTGAEMFWTAVVSRVAAEETTRYLLAGAVQVMLEHGLWDLARDADHSTRWRLIGRYVEETLRARSPHAGLMRVTTEPTQLGRHYLPAGVELVFVVAAANVDPAVFPDPHQIDLMRGNGRDHLAFGHGTHVCPGAGLARLEVRIAIDALLQQLSGLRLQNPHEIDQVAHLFFRGPARLDVTWDTTAE